MHISVVVKVYARMLVLPDHMPEVTSNELRPSTQWLPCVLCYSQLKFAMAVLDATST